MVVTISFYIGNQGYHFIDPSTIQHTLHSPDATSSQVSTPRISNVSIEVKTSVDDISEQDKVTSFVSKGCGCTLGPNKEQCFTLLNKALIMRSKGNCHELTHDELDLVVMAKICALMFVPTQHHSHHPVTTDSTVKMPRSNAWDKNLSKHCFDNIISHNLYT